MIRSPNPLLCYCFMPLTSLKTEDEKSINSSGIVFTFPAALMLKYNLQFLSILSLASSASSIFFPTPMAPWFDSSTPPFSPMAARANSASSGLPEGQTRRYPYLRRVQKPLQCPPRDHINPFKHWLPAWHMVMRVYKAFTLFSRDKIPDAW